MAVSPAQIRENHERFPLSGETSTRGCTTV
jgi:hypothetical protein